MAELGSVFAKGLGRIVRSDTRDIRYKLIDLIPTDSLTTGKKLWQTGPVLDQGQTPHCVGFAWRDWLDSAPVSEALSIPPSADTIYNEANATDGDPSQHDGTTVRAGAAIIQKLGIIQSYHWSTTLKDVALYLRNVAPVVLGTNWENKMFHPSSSGLVSLGGGIAGGHAYLAYGVDYTAKRIYCMNSWGTGWGMSGKFQMSFATLEKLLNQQGEACAALGKTVG